MNEAKIKTLKQQIQAAAIESARKFFEIEREQTGHGRCGRCLPCQESLNNLALLFKKAMEREINVLFLNEIERDSEDVQSGPPAIPIQNLRDLLN